MFKSFLWDFFSRFSNQLISFVVSIFLTRLLLPEEFGIMGIALVVISFSTIFVDLGFGRAIIQQKEISETQLSTVFFLNLIISIFFTLICFLLAEPIAVFFEQPLIKPVLRVLSLSFIFYGLNVVPNALLFRKMDFKTASIISTSSAFVSGIIGIWMARSGYGVWSLVAQNLSAGFLAFVFTFFYLKWHPQFVLILSQVKAIWRYSSLLFASALLETAFSRLDIFLIGKIFSPTTLGYYTRAQSMDGIIKQVSSASIITVLFPYISREQSDTVKIRTLYIRYLHVISFVSVFLSGFLYVCADSIFTILFTAKWMESAAIFKIMTIAGFVYPVSALMVSILTARGNSKAFLKAEIIKKLIILPAYVFGFLWGLHGFVYCLTAVFILALTVNAAFVRREIQVSLVSQIGIVLTYGFISLLVVLITILLGRGLGITGVWPQLFLHGSVFTLLFIGIHIISRTTGYQFIADKLKSVLRK